MESFKNGTKVIVKPVEGETLAQVEQKHFRLSGQVGYVKAQAGDELLWVILPEHRVYSTGMGALLRPHEIELA
jgi:hypothetical protein